MKPCTYKTENKNKRIKGKWRRLRTKESETQRRNKERAGDKTGARKTGGKHKMQKNSNLYTWFLIIQEMWSFKTPNYRPYRGKLVEVTRLLPQKSRSSPLLIVVLFPIRRYVTCRCMYPPLEQIREEMFSGRHQPWWQCCQSCFSEVWGPSYWRWSYAVLRGNTRSC